MSEWQDIASAPKDGSEVDLWTVNGRGDGLRVVDAYWNGARWIDPIGDHGDPAPVEIAPNPQRPQAYSCRATHWMRAPGAPTAA